MARPRSGPSVTATYADTGFPWKTKTGKVVRLHWYEGSDAFAERALKIGDDAIAKASKILGVTETEPVDFFVYASQDAFYAAAGPGTRENVGGFALPDIRTLFALITPDEIDAAWVGTVVPHELTHLVFDTAVKNPYHYPPRWLNEGVAVYLSEGNASDYRSDLRKGVADGRVLPLEALSGLFPAAGDQFFLAYAESVSAVAYIVDTYGRDALVKLIQAYADGVSDDQAFRAGLGVSLADVEAGWLASIGAAVPERAGPLPAPDGPVPSGWTGQSGQSGQSGQGASTAPSPGATGAPTTPDTLPGPHRRGGIAGRRLREGRVGPERPGRAASCGRGVRRGDRRRGRLGASVEGPTRSRSAAWRPSLAAGDDGRVGPATRMDARRSDGADRPARGGSGPAVRSGALALRRSHGRARGPAPAVRGHGGRRGAGRVTRATARLGRVSTWSVTLGVALFALGFLIAAQVRTEVPRVRYTSLERVPLVETATGLKAQQADLQARILDLRERIRASETATQGSGAEARSLTAQLDASRLAGGLVGLSGPGVVIQLEDPDGPVPSGGGPSDRGVSAGDLRTLVEQLSLAGADAVAVNTERIVPLSGFLDIGESILVNSAYLVPPYQVVAIGPADMYDRLTRSAGFQEWIRARVQPYALRVRYAEIPDAAVPAYAGTVRLRYARPPAVPVPSATPATPGSPRPSAAP